MYQFKDESDLIDFDDLIYEDYSTPLGLHLDSISEYTTFKDGSDLIDYEDLIDEDYSTPLGSHFSEGTVYNVTDESNLPIVVELIAEDIKIQEEGKLFDVQEQVVLQVGTSQPFMTGMVFKTKLEATNWLDNVGRRVGVVLIRGRSDFSKGRNPYIKYVCERAEICVQTIIERQRLLQPTPHQNRR